MEVRSRKYAKHFPLIALDHFPISPIPSIYTVKSRTLHMHVVCTQHQPPLLLVVAAHSYALPYPHVQFSAAVYCTSLAVRASSTASEKKKKKKYVYMY